MTPNVVASIGRDVSGLRQTVFISLPCLSGCEQVPDNVVSRNCAIKTVIVRDDLPGGEFEVVADRRMCVGVVLGR